MNALLSFIEKFLLRAMLLGFGILIAVGIMRYNLGESVSEDPWKQVQSQNTIEAYLAYLRECQSCPHQADAERELDALQRPRGLVSRLVGGHLPARASIGLPVFSPDGHTVLAASGREIDFWDANSGEHLPHGDNVFGTRGGRYLESLAYAPNDRYVAAGMSGTEAGNMLVWERKSGELIGDYMLEGYDVRTVVFAPGGSLIGWLAQGPVGVWEPTTGQFMRGTHEGVTAIAFFSSEKGPLLLLTVSGRELWFWDPATMERVRQAEVRSDRTLLGISGDGRLVAYFDGPILELWDTRKLALTATLSDHDGEVVSFCREPRTGWVVVGTRSGTLYLWDPAGPKRLGWVSAHEGPIEQVACSANGRAVTSAWDSAKVWDLEKLHQWHARREGKSLRR